jgi:Baseplate J-like protein
MSRPPYPHPVESTGREQTGDLNRLDYLPLEYADLLALQEELAVTRLGRPLPEVQGDVEEADIARTFMELSALVGHVLSVYQRHYAGEAFISTAKAPSSLVRHAHRLAYDPDPGVAASGHVVLFAKDLVGGSVAARLPLASVPLGEIKAQDYETREDVVVDAVLNELLPLHAQKPVQITPNADEVRLAGVGHGLEAGDTVALLGPKWGGFVVKNVAEDLGQDVTTIRLSGDIGGSSFEVAAIEPRPTLLAHPARTLRPFGVNADPAVFPPDKLKAATGSKPAAFPKYWYDVRRADETGYVAADVYLSEQIGQTLADEYVLRSTGFDFTVLKVTAEVVAAVTINREVEEPFTTQNVNLTPQKGGGFASSLKQAVGKQVIAGHVSGTVTAIQVSDQDGPVPRNEHPLPADWLTDWAVEVPLATTEPNPEPLGESLDLPGLLPALTPGRPLVFSDRAEQVAQVVTIQRAELIEASDLTRIWWEPVTPTPAAGWRLDDLKLFGNVARVSHGRTVEETVGGSDGVSAFQRFALSEAPLTVLQGVSGGEPELEVRVDDVLWTRVQDFADSGPDDRHYRSVTDEELVTSLVFGDGRNGAVPPSGRKNIAAVYRVGLGRAGDVEPRRLSRLKRAHPLLDRVVNVTAISGGAEPADAEAIRSQSTRWIRTFDRAVSVSDLADLALTMPGIARTASRWDQARGAVLVVATAAGEAPAAKDAVRAFLDARRDVTVPLVLEDPVARAVQITVNVEPDPAYLVEIVKDAVRTALYGDAEDAPGMFTFPARQLGQPAFLSEVYGRLEAVPGVIGVRVDRFATDGADTVEDVITADVHEWLWLAPQDLSLTAFLPGSAA